ncbi:MAG: hypothetical protein RRC34_02135 [Lentisphaeria bacterium]|nr:hypothetical protein [Lentisphaeria bacterium]
MADDSSKTGMSYWIWPPVILVAYVFSIFPAAGFFEFSGVSPSPAVQKVFEIVYFPVIWTMDHVDFFGEFMEAIADFIGL